MLCHSFFIAVTRVANKLSIRFLLIIYPTFIQKLFFCNFFFA